MKSTGTAAGIGLVVSLGLLGCAAGADAPPGGCVPNATLSCVCLDGATSMQACDLTGRAYGACQCNAMPTPPGAANAPTPAVPTTPAAPMTMTPPASSGMPTTPPVTQPPPTMTPTAPPTMMPPVMMPPTGTAGAAAMPPPVVGEDGVPAGEHCAPVASWDPAWAAFEDEVLTLTNAARAMPATCGSYGSFQPAPPLKMSAVLRCSSRLHSKDMGEKAYFAHDSMSGESPFDRMAAAGYMGFTMGENIAKGQQTPKEVVDGWMNSPGHCSNIMNADYTEIGVGYFQGMSTSTRFNSNKLWTQNFGAPRRR
jgi:uncharacterized protein YkwD